MVGVENTFYSSYPRQCITTLVLSEVRFQNLSSHSSWKRDWAKLLPTQENTVRKGRQKGSKRAKGAREPVQFSAHLVAFETRPFIGGSLVENVILRCCYISLSLPEPSLGFSRLRIPRSGRVSRGLLSGSVSFALCVMFPGAFSPAIKKLTVWAMLTSAGANVWALLTSSRLPSFHPRSFTLDMLANVCAEFLIIHVFVRMPLQIEPLDNFSTFLLWQLPRIF